MMRGGLPLGFSSERVPPKTTRAIRMRFRTRSLESVECFGRFRLFVGPCPCSSTGIGASNLTTASVQDILE